MQRKVGLVAVLVLFCGVSAYMWASRSGTETDGAIAAIKETWRCSSCEKQFELTNAEATVMLRASPHKIICPHCGEAGAQRPGILLTMQPGLPAGGGEDPGDDASGEEERPAVPGGVRGKVEQH